MLTAAMFTDFFSTLTEDLVTILPTAIIIMGGLWGLRVAMKYLKVFGR